MTEADLSNSLKNGILFMEDPVDKDVWNPHFFVLTPSKLTYTEETALSTQDDVDEEENALNGMAEVTREKWHRQNRKFAERSRK